MKALQLLLLSEAAPRLQWRRKKMGLGVKQTLPLPSPSHSDGLSSLGPVPGDPCLLKLSHLSTPAHALQWKF